MLECPQVMVPIRHVPSVSMRALVMRPPSCAVPARISKPRQRIPGNACLLKVVRIAVPRPFGSAKIAHSRATGLSSAASVDFAAQARSSPSSVTAGAHVGLFVCARCAVSISALMRSASKVSFGRYRSPIVRILNEEFAAPFGRGGGGSLLDRRSDDVVPDLVDADGDAERGPLVRSCIEPRGQQTICPNRLSQGESALLHAVEDRR